MAKKINGTNGTNVATAPVAIMFKGKSLAAIHEVAQLMITDAKSAVARLLPHIRAYRADRSYMDDAIAVSAAVVAEVNGWRKAHGDTRVLRPVNGPRASEFKARVLMADWKCCDDIMAMFADYTINDKGLLAIARYLKDNVDKKAKCPPRETLVNVVNARKAQSRGGNKKSGPIDLRDAADMMIEEANGWKLWLATQPAMKRKSKDAQVLIDKMLSDAATLALMAKTTVAA